MDIPTQGAPLADRMRPARLEEFFGQGHLLEPGKPLRQAIDTGRLHSMIFWGPPGTGKTTLARLVSARSGALFLSLSAVLAGVKDIREAVAEARRLRQMEGRATVLFIDEVHRFNKAQQDAFLPHVEDGTLTFIGATTENPSFELNNALLSRARVYVLKALEADEIRAVLRRALEDPARGLGARPLSLSQEAEGLLAASADGDARRALNLLELAAALTPGDEIGAATVAEVVSGHLRRFDKGGDLFHDQISALHKSVRGSNPDAALYWLARMIDGGCDPLYIARRLVRMACEDIGNADPRALELAINAWDAQERLGSPEGELALAQAAVYLACAAKSNAVYLAWNAALAEARASGTLEVPAHLRNAPTRLMKELGYGRAYRYAHDEPEAYAAGETYFPEQLGERRYYEPTDRGLEIRIREKLQRLRELDRAARPRRL
ncbi:MAG: replication-associated recombination protein A [Bdellovibrio bacteriovorus]